MSGERQISITHREAELVELRTSQQRAERDRQAKQRADDRERQRELARTLARIPSRLRSRGTAAYEPDHPEGFSGYVQSFSCGCDKPDHHPFTGINEPTELVFIDPAEEARKLAERVNRARTQTPPAARSSSVPLRREAPTTGRPMRR